MSSSVPMMPWYEGDFLKATIGWTFAQRSLYRCLLCASWELESLPDDEEELARIAGASPEEFAAGWPRVKSKFERGADGRLRNMKLEEHRTVALEKRTKKINAGRAGGKASVKARTKQRLNGRSTDASTDASTNVQANGQANAKPPSPSPSPSSKKEEDSRRGDESPREFIWRVGVDLLTRAGERDQPARAFLGKLCKDFGDDEVREAIGRAVAVAPAEPKAWLQAALRHAHGSTEPPRAI